jgi:enoyl-CoA hydratase
MTGQNALARYDVADRVATITLDSPHNRNALSARMVDELQERLAEAGADPAVRAIVLTHTGRVFCAGADLSEAGSGSMKDTTSAITAMLTTIVTLPKPVIAKVAGHVRAGGMGIVGACDLAVATENATFAFTEARIGVSPAIISLTTLDVLEPRAAARYYVTGAPFDAAEAARIGMITAASTQDVVDGVVGGWLDEIKQTSPQGSAQSKALVTAARRRRIAEDGERLADLSAQLFASDEAQEGIHAFLEKR